MTIEALVAAELAAPVDPRVRDFAAAIAAQHGTASRAVLFYGSCLRERSFEGLMLDFYLIVSDYRQAYAKRWLAVANRLLPPNVFPVTHDHLAAKYAVLSEADFARLNGPAASSVSVWARFAQPARLVWAADEAARARCVQSVAQAAPTLVSLARYLDDRRDPLSVWRAGFAQTYRAELRAERKDRSASIVDLDAERYVRFGAALADLAGVPAKDARRRWASLRRNGKLLSVLRLAKASFTFAGGADYLAWKINRHAGTQIELKPWQRRWPLLGALVLVPRLLARGAIR